jgi:serine/threonine protein kinase
MEDDSRVLNERFQIEELIAEGGFSRVYRGNDLQMKRKVAIKIVHPARAGDLVALDRIAKEAERSSILHHQNILPLYEYGRDNDTAYLILPYIEGGTLQDLLRRKGALEPSEVLNIIRQIAAALDYIHQKGFIHCDVKPQNILLADKNSDHVYLADFTLATLQQEATSPVTIGSAGTVAYMAPEQFEGRAFPTTDIYGLGEIACFLLTGRVPYEGNTKQVMQDKRSGKVPSVADYRPGALPRSLDRVLKRAMARDPRRRYSSASEFAVALATAVNSYDAGATNPAGFGPAAAADQFAAALSAIEHRSRSAYRVLVIVVAVALLVNALGLAWLLRRLGAPPAVSASPTVVLAAPTMTTAIALATPSPVPAGPSAAPAGSSPPHHVLPRRRRHPRGLRLQLWA